MTSQKIIEIQNEIASLIFENAPNDWKIFRINIEMIFDKEDLDRSSRIVYCYKGELLEYDKDYSPDRNFAGKFCECFEKLNNLFLEQGERWKVCDFIINDTGKYKVNYSYDSPPRISGDIFAGSNDTRPNIEPYI